MKLSAAYGYGKILLIVLLGMISQACMTQSELLVKKADKASREFAAKASKGTVYKFKSDTVIVDQPTKKVKLVMNENFAYIPFRLENTLQYIDWFKESLGRRFRSYSVSIESMGKEIRELIPNYYRDQTVASDPGRLSQPTQPRIPIVHNISGGIHFAEGLSNRNIALWHSHGWYYQNTLDRWGWQRPRLFNPFQDTHCPRKR